MSNLAGLPALGQKQPPLVSRPVLRQSARGETCTLRLPGCHGGTETTILAHLLRFFGWAEDHRSPTTPRRLRLPALSRHR